MNRLSDSARVAITFKPLRASSRQSGGGGSRRSKLSRLPAIDLMGASELFISCPSTRTRRCQAFAFLFAQGAAQIGQHDQLVRQTAFAKVAPSDAPVGPQPPGNVSVRRRVFIGIEARRQAEIARAPAEQLVDWLRRADFRRRD